MAIYEDIDRGPFLAFVWAAGNMHYLCAPVSLLLSTDGGFSLLE